MINRSGLTMVILIIIIITLITISSIVTIFVNHDMINNTKEYVFINEGESLDEKLLVSKKYDLTTGNIDIAGTIENFIINVGDYTVNQYSISNSNNVVLSVKSKHKDYDYTWVISAEEEIVRNKSMEYFEYDLSEDKNSAIIVGLSQEGIDYLSNNSNVILNVPTSVFINDQPYYITEFSLFAKDIEELNSNYQGTNFEDYWNNYIIPKYGISYTYTNSVEYADNNTEVENIFCHIKTINLPNRLLKINFNAIGRDILYCANLEEVIMPNTVTEIEYEAFYNCKSLKKIVLSDSLITIGNQVFANCQSLTSIIIPLLVANIGDNIFLNCNSLDAVYCKNSDSVSWASELENISEDTGLNTRIIWEY